MRISGVRRGEERKGLEVVAVVGGGGVSGLVDSKWKQMEGMCKE